MSVVQSEILVPRSFLPTRSAFYWSSSGTSTVLQRARYQDAVNTNGLVTIPLGNCALLDCGPGISINIITLQTY
jgi:hypothetical protein